MMTGDLFAILDGGAKPAPPLLVVQMPGAPRGKGRPRFRIVIPKPGGKAWARGQRAPFGVVYTDDKTEGYESALRQLASIKMGARAPYEGPLAIRVFAMMPIPKSWPQRDRDAAAVGTKIPECKPDGDNILKIVEDALNGVVWVDDSQVARSLVWKEYGTDPGVIVEVYRIP